MDSNNFKNVWFWQLIVSPHMAHLAIAMTKLGCKVTYVAERPMTAERAEQGWAVPELAGVTLLWADSDDEVHALIDSAPADSIHICQGIRANGRVAKAQKALAMRQLTQWIVMETVDDAGWRGILKRIEYGRLFRLRKDRLTGVLATGHKTADWIAARGLSSKKIFPFAYFLPNSRSTAQHQRQPGPYRFLFAGRLIPLKRCDWLIEAAAELSDQNFELWFVGAGVEESVLRELAKSKLGDRVRWVGQLPMSDVPAIMAQADCLVLPSVHDGWGAVASEAMMVGTPVVCSSACGVAGVVQASNYGGMFPVDDKKALKDVLAVQLQMGKVSAQARDHLSTWSMCLGSTAGARYLLEILMSDGKQRIAAPWEQKQK